MPNIHVMMYEQTPIILVDNGEHRGYYRETRRLCY